MELPRVDRFTMFGCWNDGICDSKDPRLNGMSSVFNSLMTSSFDPSLYIVAGDNYYPATVKDSGVKTKVFNITALESGFQCLASLSARDNTPVYLLMGNHDLQAERDFGPGEECKIIREELRLTQGTTIDTSTMVLQSKDTVFIFLDTNLYESKAEDKYARCELVYRSDMDSLDGLSNKKKIERITGAVQDKISRALTAIAKRGIPINQIITVGHHPIIGTKRKKDKESGEVKYKNQRIDDQGAGFIASCNQMFPDAQCVYLCADIHQYQESEVIIHGMERPIHQYIVGTGGAELDKLLPERGTVIKNGILTYSYLGGDVANGYLNVHRKPGMPYVFEFVHTSTSYSSRGEGVAHRKKSRKKSSRMSKKRVGRYSKRRQERRRRRRVSRRSRT